MFWLADYELDSLFCNIFTRASTVSILDNHLLHVVRIIFMKNIFELKKFLLRLPTEGYALPPIRHAELVSASKQALIDPETSSG
ncbi:MAG: hypothetical protein HY960_15795 [Ignavibacteriae bacterium]|nr:hypothetical protein [Ignavibacteriota bacterium]